MCGYLGQISYQDINNKIVSECNEAIVCRGPDEKKILIGNSSNEFNASVDFNFSFIFNRLSILDLSSNASQPMVSEEFNTLLMFNGEVYNHEELREDLENNNIKFQSSHSDTEVILNGISHYGIKFVDKLVGQFSIVFIDFKINKIYLIRDRVGQKPLFYTHNNENLYFGSNLKSIKKMSNQKGVDDEQLNNFLNLGVVPSPFTIYENIYKVCPGEIIEFTFSNNKIFQDKYFYWEPSEFISDEAFKDSEIIELMKESVNLRMRADVDIANFLSGGIDSTSIIKMASENNKLNTYSMSIYESSYDESKWFNFVSTKFKTNNTTINLDSENISEEEILNSINIFDEPYSDPSTIPSYLLSKEISTKYKVAVSGDGGDELFGGYDRLSLTLQKKTLFSYVLSKLYKVYPAYLGTGNRLLRHSRDVNTSFPSFLEDKKLMSLLGVKSKFNFSKNYLNNSEDKIKNILIAEIKFYLSEMMMLKVDRTSMANSLEVRSPFVDHRLIEYILMHNFESENLKNPKKILKNYLKPEFSDEFVNRKKMGFVFDLENWVYRNKTFITSKIKSSEALDHLNTNKLLRLYKFKSRINALRIWKLFFLAIYLNE
tara:strand:+ start:26071 stop:27873 length:1803 start_codon:yes stop_codon:yes gene_type:complete